MEQNKYINPMASTQYIAKIRDWDWPLHVGIKPRIPIEDRDSEGDLLCVRTITIETIVVAPEIHSSKSMIVELTPLPRDVIIDDGVERVVGRVYNYPDERDGPGFYTRLFLPEDTLSSVLFCLSAKWRSISVWIDEDTEPGSVEHFAFSGDGVSAQTL